MNSGPDRLIRRDTIGSRFFMWMTAFLLGFVMSPPQSAMAGNRPALASSRHPVSVTRTQLFVTQSHVEASIDVFLEDLYLFQQLMPNEADFLTAETLRAGVELHKDFLKRKFRLQLDDGRYLLPSELVEVESAIPESGVALGALMTHQVTFRLFYSLPEPIQHLAVFQEFTDDSGVLLSEMQLSVKQEGHEPLAPKVLSAGMPMICRFDWINPPMNREASTEERKAFEQRARSDLLGITSYSSVYSFLYVERNQIRHEILIPLMTLEQVVPIPRAERHTLTIAEQDAVKSAVARYFSTGNPLVVNGAPAIPAVDRVDFFGLSLRDFAVLSERRDVSMASGRVGIILTTPLQDEPQQVELTWDLFHKSLLAVKTVLIAPGEISQHTLTRVGGRNRVEWKGRFTPEPSGVQPLLAHVKKIPEFRISIPAALAVIAAGVFSVRSKSKLTVRISASVACLIFAIAASKMAWWQLSVATGPRPLPTHASATTIVHHLLQGVYLAMREPDESSVYDALSRVTSGEVRERVYVEMLNSLKMSEQGGAVARVEEFRVDSVSHASPVTTASRVITASIPSDQAWSAQVTWTVAGTVEHWGHAHERTNQFTADLVVDTSATEPACWQILRMEVINGERISFRTRIRGE